MPYFLNLLFPRKHPAFLGRSERLERNLTFNIDIIAMSRINVKGTYVMAQAFVDQHDIHVEILIIGTVRYKQLGTHCDIDNNA